MKKAIMLAILCGGMTANAETVKCEMNLNRADGTSTTKATSIKVEDQEGEIEFVDKSTGNIFVLAVTTPDLVKGLYQLQFRHYPTNQSTSEDITAANVLLMANQTEEGLEDDLIISLKGSKKDTLLSLHPKVSLSPSLQAMYLTKKASRALRELGYKGGSVFDGMTEIENLKPLISEALAKGTLKKEDITLFGVSSNCRSSSK